MRVPIARALGLAAGFVVFGAVAAGPARISVDSPSVMEGDGPAPATLAFTLTRSGETGSTVTLGYQVDDNTATAPGDYVAILPSTLTFASGQTQATVPVTINGDSVIEDDESLFLHLTAIVSVQGAPASYASASPFSAGGSPAAVIASDVNGDGRQDLLVANAGSDSVSVLLNTTAPGTAPGSGVMTYAAASSFAVGNSPRSVTVADVDADGRPDLAVANSGSDSVSVLLNTSEPGSGVMTYAAAIDFATGSSPRAVTATDVDGDGRPDLAVANSGSDSVSVLLNATEPGSGVIAYAAASTFTVGNSPRSVTATDVDGDGRPDLAVASADSDNVSVLLNTTEPGAGVIAYAAATGFAAGDSPRSVTAADIDGDGRPDLAVANADGNSVSVLLNTTEPGTGVITYAAATDFAAGTSPRAVTAADVDGDGRADLAVANAGSDSVSVLLNTTGPGATVATFADAGNFAAGNGAGALAAADVDGDGRPDLAVANVDRIAVLLNRPAVFDVSEGTGTLENDDSSATPDAFHFVDQAGVERDADITSAPVTVSGITVPVRIEVSGGKYSVGCTTSFRSSSSFVLNGMTVCVRHKSSRDFGAETDTLLTIGGVSDTFTSVTEGADTMPDPFAFTDVRNALLNSPQVSNSVTIRGIRGAAPISVLGGEYSVGCTATFTGTAGTIDSGATVCVRHTSSALHGTATDTTLTVGGLSDTFTSTTPAAQDYSQTGALAPLDALLLLAALGGARRRRAKKIRSLGCPCERIF